PRSAGTRPGPLKLWSRPPTVVGPDASAAPCATARQHAHRGDGRGARGARVEPRPRRPERAAGLHPGHFVDSIKMQSCLNGVAPIIGGDVTFPRSISLWRDTTTHRHAMEGATSAPYKTK